MTLLVVPDDCIVITSCCALARVVHGLLLFSHADDVSQVTSGLVLKVSLLSRTQCGHVLFAARLLVPLVLNLALHLALVTVTFDCSDVPSFV